MTDKIIENGLKNISSHKATGLDGIRVHMLKAAIPTILPSLLDTYNTSIKTTTLPSAFKPYNLQQYSRIGFMRDNYRNAATITETRRQNDTKC